MSASGAWSSPAACPMAGHQGKCTSDDGGEQKVERFYTGADVAYAHDFCVNTALGTWSGAY